MVAGEQPVVLKDKHIVGLKSERPENHCTALYDIYIYIYLYIHTYYTTEIHAVYQLYNDIYCGYCTMMLLFVVLNEFRAYRAHYYSSMLQETSLLMTLWQALRWPLSTSGPMYLRGVW